MSYYDNFIPGQWVDHIDTNDFVDLNKKPFFKSPYFLCIPTEKTNSLLKEATTLIHTETRNIEPTPSSMRDTKHDKNSALNQLIPGVQDKSLKKRYGFSETPRDLLGYYRFDKYPEIPKMKTVYDIFEDISTSEFQKLFKIDLIKYAPSNFTPSLIHPDVRKIALYGTKAIIKDKKDYLKSLEKHLKTTEWIERRILFNEEIDALKELEKFCKKHGVDVSTPANSAEKAISVCYLTILASVIENPSVPFSLTQIIPFIDIFIHADIENEVISEESAQELIDHFYIKLCLIRFVVSPSIPIHHKAEPFFMGETFGGTYITKTTYRFLHSVKNFNLHPFSVRILVDPSTPLPFKEFCEELLKQRIPVTFFSTRIFKNKKDQCIFPYGQAGIPGEDIVLDGGSCDLEKLLYLSINGGKSTEGKINLASITQPLRTDDFSLDDVMRRFKDFSQHILTLYAEMINVLFYLNETHLKLTIRKSLMNNLNYYKAQFGFSNFSTFLKILSAVKEGNFNVVRDNKGRIEEVEVLKEQKIDPSLPSQISSFILKELKRIPIHKNGRPFIRFYDKEMLDLSQTEDGLFENTIAPEYIPALFPKSLHNENLAIGFDDIEQLIKNNITEINISTNHSISNKNGILYR